MACVERKRESTGTKSVWLPAAAPLFGAVPDAGPTPLAGAGLEAVGSAAGPAEVAAGDELPAAGAEGAVAAGAEVAGFKFVAADAAGLEASELPTAELAAGAALEAAGAGVGVVDDSIGFCVVVEAGAATDDCVGLVTLEPFNGTRSRFCGIVDKLGCMSAAAEPTEGTGAADPAGTADGAAGISMVDAADSTG